MSTMSFLGYLYFPYFSAYPARVTMTSQSDQLGGWIPDESTFGARLALVRQKMRWGNIVTAAEACGLPAESWRTWERDGMTPRRIVVVAKQIAGATGCDYLWLLLGPDAARV